MQTLLSTRRLVWLAMAFSLTACGGGGSGNSSPPPSVTPLDDQYTVPAGAAAVLAVSGNDTATGGTPTLSVATAPAHGKVVVQGTSLQYTPDAGYMGDDQFSYRTEVGSATGTATVKLAVEAEIELSGSVPAINSLTEVTAQVGDSQVKVNTDDNGAYKLSFKTSKPKAFITLTARESGARAGMTRASLVGEVGSLFTQVGPRIGAAQWPALVLDALSTARHGLLKQHGRQPATTAELKTALASQDPTDLLDIATLLRHAYQDGAALPASVANTTELAANGAALGTFNQQWLGGSITDPARIEQTLAEVTATAPPVLTGQAGRLAIHHQGANPVTAPTGALFELHADGSATGIVWTFSTNTAINASWTASGNTVTVSLSTPLPMDGSYRVHALQLRPLRGVDAQPGPGLIARWLTDCQMSPTSPARACSTPSYSRWLPVVGFDTERDRQPLRLEDFVAGTTWAGLVLETDARLAPSMVRTQAFTVDGTPNLPGFSGRLVDGRWQLTGAQTAYRYTRLGAGPEDGMAYWLAELQENGTTTRAKLLLVAKGAAVAPFDIAAAARRWAGGSQDANGSADPTGLRYSGYGAILHKDGRIAYGSGTSEVDGRGRWALSADGRSIIETRNSDGAQFTMYAPVRAVRGGYLAMSASGGLVRMRDAGPAD